MPSPAFTSMEVQPATSSTPLMIEVLLMLDEKNSALTLQVLWVGFKSDKVYFHRKAREIGESRWTLSKKISQPFELPHKKSVLPPARCNRE